MMRIGVEWGNGWRCGGWSCTGQEYLYIYIYNSETPSWLHSSDEEPVRCNGMTGCRGGRGVILASSVVSSGCPDAIQLQIKQKGMLLVSVILSAHASATIHHAADKLGSRCVKQISLLVKRRQLLCSSGCHIRKASKYKYNCMYRKTGV